MNILFLLLSVACGYSDDGTKTGFKRLDRFMQRIERRHLRKIDRTYYQKGVDSIENFNGYWNTN
jgi:hypothetical protein|tara:strand:- start:648 stop:839 length:192 start_codon:yes stop_codon:yes gene_type:complete